MSNGIDWSTVVVGAGALAATGLAIVREWSARGGRRTSVKQQVDLLNALPAESTARKQLLDHVDSQVLRLIQEDSTMSRDRFGIGVSVAFTAIALWTVTAAVDHWYVVPIAVLSVVFAIVGFAVSVPRAVRDDKGTKIKP